MKAIICKILGHRWKYNFTWMPNKATCKRCGIIYKMRFNPKPESIHDIEIWEKQAPI